MVASLQKVDCLGIMMSSVWVGGREGLYMVAGLQSRATSLLLNLAKERAKRSPSNLVKVDN